MARSDLGRRVLALARLTGARSPPPRDFAKSVKVARVTDTAMILPSSGCLWNGRWPGSESPFCALPLAIDLDDGAIHHRKLHIRLV